MNSRSKDYYDIYIITKLKKDDIDKELLKKAFRRTFKHRATELDYNKISRLLYQLLDDKDFLKRWEAYRKKNLYVSASFEEVIASSIELVRGLK